LRLFWCIEAASYLVYLYSMKLLGFFQTRFTYVNHWTVYFIHTVMKWTCMNVFRARFFHHAALYSFVFPSHSLLDVRRKKRVYLYQIVLLLVIFFSFLLMGFFQAWVNIFVRMISFECITYFLCQYILSFRFLLIFLWSIDESEG